MNPQIKQGYADAIAQFLANGGKITPAVNINKAEFNYCNADTTLKSAERPNSHQNHILRTRAEKQGLKSYKPVAPCKSCGTSERSVKSNACLECDRRRARAKNGISAKNISAKNIEAVGHYLLANNKVVEFTSGGQTYVLKVEVA